MACAYISEPFPFNLPLVLTINFVGRVFQFQEGDRGSSNSSSKSLMKVFLKGFYFSIMLHKQYRYFIVPLVFVKSFCLIFLAI